MTWNLRYSVNKGGIQMIINPDNMGYKDRGMMKWFSQRMMLSDHLDRLKKKKNPEPLIDHEAKEKQNIKIN